MLIKDLKTTKEFFTKKIRQAIFGVGVWAFNRLGLENIYPDYQILCLRHSPDTALIEKDLKVLALEKGLGAKHLDLPRNSTSVLHHKKVQQYLAQFRQPLVIPYKASSKMERICQKNNWILGIAPTKFGKELFENKILFRQILEKLDVPVPPGKIVKFKELSFEKTKQEPGLPLVVQHPTRGGGKGTFFVRQKQDFENAYKNLIGSPDEQNPEPDEPQQVVVAKFIEGPSPSLACCVTRHGILNSNLQMQILDIPSLFNPQKGSGLFCGHDWTFAQNFSASLNQQATEIAQKIGSYFQKQGYKGIFGLDFVIDQKNQRLYVVECNPRMTGAFPTLEMALEESGAPPLLCFHALEYLNLDYDLDVAAINQLLQKPKQAAHMFMHNLSEHWAYNFGVVEPGVYALGKKHELVFRRPGYRLQDINYEDEFLITEGVPVYKRHFSPNRRLCRILTKGQVLKEAGQLNSWGENIIRTTYQSLKLKPIHFVKAKKLLNPQRLAKG